MKTNEFDKRVREILGPVVGPFGFTVEKSLRCTYWRRLPSGVYHLIVPDMDTRRHWYDLKVFAHAEVLDPAFSTLFPDDLGVPSDVYSHLNDCEGVGLTQQTFPCKTVEALNNTMTRTVLPLLKTHGLPYLNKFKTLEDVLPVIVDPITRAFALCALDRDSEAIDILRSKLNWLDSLDASDAGVAATRRRVDEILARSVH